MGQKAPVVIESEEIFDLFGNVGEAIHDTWLEDHMNKGRPIDQVSTSDFEGGGVIHFRGGSAGVWGDNGVGRADLDKVTMEKNQRSPFAGFRLVRVLKPRSKDGAR